MESSVHAFALTVERQLADVNGLLTKLNDPVDSIDEVSIEDMETDDPEFESLLVGRKVKVLMQDVDRIRWRQDLTEDRNRLATLLSNARAVDRTRDAKLAALRALVKVKVAQPINTVDGRPNRFVLVQLPEPLGQRSGELKTIADITRERLRRAAKTQREAQPIFAGDRGFRACKLDSSNIRAWSPDPDDLQTTLEEHTEHLLPNRSEQDVLYELLLKLGLDLTVPIETRQIAGKTVHNIGVGALMVCLSDGIDRGVAEALAMMGIAQWQKAQAEALQVGGDDKNKPVGTKLVFKDRAFADDVAKTNLAAILSQHGLDDVRSI